MKTDQKRWDDRYGPDEYALGREPNPFLKNHIRLLPPGRALDIAAGEGRNSVFLALHGFEVEAVDISKAGLAKARRLSREEGVRIRTVCADLDDFVIPREGYDLIADFYFLNRTLIPRMKRGVKQGGRVIFETYLLEHRDRGLGGPGHARYYLRPNELLHLFSDFRVLFYREGTFREGGRVKAVASLIAEKP
jgi:tellurite methyltransferase